MEQQIDMSKNNLRVKVGLTLLTLSNRWISVNEVAFLSGATVRQMQSALSHIPDLNVIYDRTEVCRCMYLKADEAEQRRIFIHLMSWRYKNPSILDSVLDKIPYNGWISCKDLAHDTGIHQTDIYRMLNGCSSIDVSPDRDSGKMKMYRRRDSEIHV